MQTSTSIRCILSLVTACLLSLDAAAANEQPITISASESTTTAASQPVHQHNASYDYYVSGDPTTPRTAVARGGLMLMGGGQEVDSAWRWLIAKSGNGHVLILRSSGADSYHDYLLHHVGGVASVETLVLHSSAAAKDTHVLEVIARADSIFIADDDTAAYIRVWKGAAITAALDRHVASGKPLGANAGGAAILGHYSFIERDGEDIDSHTAMRNPLSSEITPERDLLHLHILDDVIIDTHFTTRKRLGRLIAFVTRLVAQEKKPQIYGIGVDENTALCVEADGTARVHSGSNGRVWLVKLQQPATVLQAGKPLSIEDVRIIALDAHSSVDLKTFAVEQPAKSSMMRVVRGELGLH